jgi:hypothetical protein
MATTINARSALLLSHALATWGWRTWEFVVALLLSELYPGACVCTRARAAAIASAVGASAAPCLLKR